MSVSRLWSPRVTTKADCQPTFTNARWFGQDGQRVTGTGLYCSCGWVWGMGNRLAAERAFDNHLLSEMGVQRIT